LYDSFLFDELRAASARTVSMHLTVESRAALDLNGPSKWQTTVKVNPLRMSPPLALAEWISRHWRAPEQSHSFAADNATTGNG